MADGIEEAIQYACKSFLAEAAGLSAPGQVYAWIRTAALRSLGHEADRHHRELAVHLVDDSGIVTVADDDPGPAEKLITLEDHADLAMLVEKVSSSLSERGRDVFALYGAGYKRPEIADRLGISEREVKRDLRLIMDRARAGPGHDVSSPPSGRARPLCPALSSKGRREPSALAALVPVVSAGPLHPRWRRGDR